MAQPVVLLSVAGAAELLGMKRSNVAKFLERRGIEPYAEGRRGKLWLQEAVEGAKAEYDSDATKRAADERRRAAALGTPSTRVATTNGKPGKLPPVLGRTQRRVLLEAAVAPVQPAGHEDSTAVRFACMRLEERGFMRADRNRPRSYDLTGKGRELVARLQSE